MRAFISIELPEEIKDELVGIQQKLSGEGLFSGKIIGRENLHLTLKFLGEIDDKQFVNVEERLKKLNFCSFKVRLNELGFFNERFIKIVWIGLKNGELKELQKGIDSLLDGLFEKETRFMGHITIARPKGIKEREKFIEELKKIRINKKEFIVDKIYLRESLLSKRGPEYSDVLIIKSKEGI